MNLFADIVTYAYRGSGKYILILCVILSIVAKLAGFAPLVGPIAALLISAYFCAIYFQMIESSATGGKEAPEFPDVANFIEDILWPMLQIIIVALLSFGPLVGYSIWAGEARFDPAIGFGLMSLGVIYFPMAMLAVVVLGYTWAISPHIVIPAIFRGGWIYWFGVLLLCLLYAVGWIIGNELSGYFLVSPIVMSVVSSYTLMTHARVLGVVYRERQEELGWV